MTPQEREREARNRMVTLRTGPAMPFVAAMYELIESVEARVRWEQQADAEGYTNNQEGR